MISEHFYLAEELMARLCPFFPESRGNSPVNDRRVQSGILYSKNNGLQWKGAPAMNGPPKTIGSRFVRWSRLGVFARIFFELAQPEPDDEIIMIHSTHLKVHRTAASLQKR